MHLDHAVSLVRRDIGDPPETFLTTSLSDSTSVLYDLPQQNVNPVGLIVRYMSGASNITLQPTSSYIPWLNSTAYVTGNLVTFNDNYFHCLVNNTNVPPNSDGTSSTDWAADIAYSLDSVEGTLTLTSPLPNNATFIVTGQAWGLFTDEDIESFIHDATRQHCQGQTITERFRTAQGFYSYRDTAKNLHNLPKQEETLVVTLADIGALWVLATDSATDVNVQTAEGTNIDRVARYQQIMGHIEALTEKYKLYAGEWNVGMFRMETLNLRRVSRTNGRLVPIYRDREYDDHRYPVRELPQIDRREEDGSGIPSPIWNGSPL